MSIASTPEPPYFAVIFTSIRTESDDGGYAIMADRMTELAAQQDGFLGVESVRGVDGCGITVSYWRDPESIRQWRADSEHLAAQATGRSDWYAAYRVRISHVQRDYGFEP